MYGQKHITEQKTQPTEESQQISARHQEQLQQMKREVDQFLQQQTKQETQYQNKLLELKPWQLKIQKHIEFLAKEGKLLNKNPMSNIIKRLGGGSFGNVWLVEIDGKKFACKVLEYSKYASNPDAVTKYIIREMEISLECCKSLGNVLGMVGAYFPHTWKLDLNNICIVMPYIDGSNLADFIKKCLWNRNCGEISSMGKMRMILDILRGIIEGLHTLNSILEIAHRDIKPENILLCENNRPSHGDVISDATRNRFDVRIVDYGLARKMPPEQTASDLMNISCVGTYGYAEPIDYTSTKSIRHTDKFALGSVIYDIFICTQNDDFPSGDCKIRLTKCKTYSELIKEMKSSGLRFAPELEPMWMPREHLCALAIKCIHTDIEFFEMKNILGISLGKINHTRDVCQSLAEFVINNAKKREAENATTGTKTGEGINH